MPDRYVLNIRRLTSTLTCTSRPLLISSITLFQYLLADTVRGSVHPNNQVLLLRTRVILPLTLTDVNFVGDKACENPQDSTSTLLLPLVAERLRLSCPILLGLVGASVTWAQVNKAPCTRTPPRALVRLVLCMFLARWGRPQRMCMRVGPLQRRGAMQGQVALWGVQGCLVGMALETSAGDQRPVLMVLEMYKQLGSMASVWLEVLAEMLERTAERSVASGQCFAVDESHAFVAPNDDSRADDCTLHSDWLSALRQLPADQCHPPITHTYTGAARPGDDNSVINATKTCPLICFPLLPCLPCFDPVLSRRTIYFMRALQRHK